MVGTAKEIVWWVFSLSSLYCEYKLVDKSKPNVDTNVILKWFHYCWYWYSSLTRICFWLIHGLISLVKKCKGDSQSAKKPKLYLCNFEHILVRQADHETKSLILATFLPVHSCTHTPISWAPFILPLADAICQRVQVSVSSEDWIMETTPSWPQSCCWQDWSIHTQCDTSRIHWKWCPFQMTPTVYRGQP